MILLRKPDTPSIQRYLAQQTAESLSYPEVGATNDQLPEGYSINHTRKRVGQGEAAFRIACEGLQARCQLQLGWVSSWPRDADLREGEHAAVLGRAFGLWWLNACRITYVIDERNERHPGKRFGYAHGTLPDHLASGEERFLVEMLDDESVWIDILAFSRPQTWVARLGYPYMRLAQKRFGKESSAKLARYVAERCVQAPLPPAPREPLASLR